MWVPRCQTMLSISWCRGYCVIFPTDHSVNYNGRKETDWHGCSLDADTWGHRGVVPAGFYDRPSMIMRTGSMAAAATEHERPL